jgi:hypothetical protein
MTFTNTDRLKKEVSIQYLPDVMWYDKKWQVLRKICLLKIKIIQEIKK